ncbi:MAG: glycosyltransferase [Chloroflexota bacterium]|nr:MAG: glycosyltransferase [Chloroflexota bacterium]
MQRGEKRVLIGGYYGFGNTGDEAILAATVRMLRARCSGLQVTVASGDPVETARRHPVDALLWSDIPALLDAARRADLIVLGGGGVFFDYWGFDPSGLLTRTDCGTAYYANFPMLAALFNRPLMVNAVGVGPLHTDEGRRYTRLAFLQAGAASVRDPESARWLLDLGVEKDRFELTADPAFGLEPVPAERAVEILRAEGIALDRPLIGVALREWDAGARTGSWQAEVATALDRLIELCDAQLLFVPFQKVNMPSLRDHEALREVRELMAHGERAAILQGVYGPEEIAGVLGRCELVLGMRLHALIFAALGLVPAVGLAYDPKVHQTMCQLGLERYAIDLAELSSGRLAETLAMAWNCRERLRSELGPVVQALSGLAERNAELAANLLEETHVPALHPEAIGAVQDCTVRLSSRLFAVETQLDQARLAFNQRELALEDQLSASQEHALALEDQLRASQGRVVELNASLEQTLCNLRETQWRLDAIHHSMGGVILRALWRIRSSLMPVGSRREDLGRLGIRLLIREPREALDRLGSELQILRDPRGDWERVKRWVRLPRGPFAPTYIFEDNSEVTVYSNDPSLFPDYPRRRCPQAHPSSRHVTVALIATVRNECTGVQRWIDAVLCQSRLPDEIVVVDGGSTDGTLDVLHAAAHTSPVPFRVVVEPGASIARGRNLAVRACGAEVIAVTDFGCTPRSTWLENLIAPFEVEPDTQVVGGWYETIGKNGKVIRERGWPGLDQVHPAYFLPSSRSLAFTRDAFEAVGGYPEWLTLTGEDTYFDLELKRYRRGWAFAPDAVVNWHAPETALDYWRKTRTWATGDGESGVFAELYWHSALRSLGLGAVALGELTAVAAALVGIGIASPELTAVGAVVTVAGLTGITAGAVRIGQRSGLDARGLLHSAGCEVARTAGFLAGARRRVAVVRRRLLASNGLVLMLSGVPIDDTGGGARCTQLSLEFLRKGYSVVFINKFPKYESVELDLQIAHPNLKTISMAEFSWDTLQREFGVLMEAKPLLAVVEFPVSDFLDTIANVRAAGGFVVYDLLDAWDSSLGGDWYSPEVERKVVDYSQVLVATVKSLADRLRRLSGREVALLPNAVNSRLFDPSRTYSRPADMPEAPWSMIYVGALWGEWFDWNLLLRLADAYPEAAVVVVGDYRGQCPEPRPNLHFLGLKPQRVLPAYLAHADVAIIPWKINPITQETSPLKVYEYLAMHKPVVAPDIIPLRGLPAVFLAKDEDDFAGLVGRVRSIQHPTREVRQFIARNNWQSAVDELIDLISPARSEVPVGVAGDK